MTGTVQEFGSVRGGGSELALAHAVAVQRLDDGRLYGIVVREDSLSLLEFLRGHTVQARQLLRTVECGEVATVVVEPGQPGVGVILGRRRHAGWRGARRLEVLLAVENMHEAAGTRRPDPRFEAVLVPVDLLTHETTRRQAHLGGWCLRRHGVPVRPRVSCGLFLHPGLVAHGLHGIREDLQPAVLRRAGQLLLGRVALPQRHGDELADHPLPDTEAVQPRPIGHRQVVLRPTGQLVCPAFSRQGVDFPRRYLDGHRIGGVEVEPQRFRLIHGQEDAAVPAPRFR